MNNYKIKVNGATTKEAQILLEQLGYTTGTGCGLNHAVWLFAESNGTVNYSSTDDFISDVDYQELTLPQLRDLVAQSKFKQQGLISGADALRALAEGKEVEYLGETKTWFSLNKETSAWSLTEVLTATDLKEGTSFKFRLKPRTITLSLEIPAPFEPKDKEEAWCLDGYTLNGYRKIIFDDFDDAVIGFWRTEEEIKQVVAALRGGIKA